MVWIGLMERLGTAGAGEFKVGFFEGFFLRAP
jgi:hypothetical protein